MDYNNTAAASSSSSSAPYPTDASLKSHSHSSNNSTASAPPPPPYAASPAASPSAPPPRLLHVYHQGLTHRTTQVLGPDKSTLLYTVKSSSCCLFGSKPHVTVHDGAGNTVGTVTFHSLSQKIDLVVHGEPIVFAPAGHFTCSHEWTSLAAAGGGEKGGKETAAAGGNGGGPMRFTWKSDKWHGLDLVCKDERKTVHARFDASTWAVHKEGKFEMEEASSVGGGGARALMDELIVTGFAMLELRRRNGSTASA